jgi:hypothetical protein
MIRIVHMGTERTLGQIIVAEMAPREKIEAVERNLDVFNVSQLQYLKSFFERSASDRDSYPNHQVPSSVVTELLISKWNDCAINAPRIIGKLKLPRELDWNEKNSVVKLLDSVSGLAFNINEASPYLVMPAISTYIGEIIKDREQS